MSVHQLPLSFIIMLEKLKVKKLPTVKYKTSAMENVKEIAGQSYTEQIK